MGCDPHDLNALPVPKKVELLIREPRHPPNVEAAFLIDLRVGEAPDDLAFRRDFVNVSRRAIGDERVAVLEALVRSSPLREELVSFLVPGYGACRHIELENPGFLGSVVEE
jgi:hypothetical protein